MCDCPKTWIWKPSFLELADAIKEGRTEEFYSEQRRRLDQQALNLTEMARKKLKR